MADQSIHVTVGGQTVQVTVEECQIKAAVDDACLDITVPLVLAPGKWPFGANPNRVEGIAQGVPTILDRVAMPGKYQAVKWLVLIADATNGLGVSSEINVFMRGGTVEFTEYAVMGDIEAVDYVMACAGDGAFVNLTMTSNSPGFLVANTMKIGMFS